MAFVFKWPQFSKSFYTNATELLNEALNKGDMPPIIADTITVKHLDMGTIPPDLDILEIGELTTDRFRGIFRLSYSGDASIELKTRIQANPLVNSAPTHPLTPNAAPLFAAAPLIVPMTLKLSSLQLRAILTLVISRQRGITLVVKNDALESLHVSSSFDSITAIQSYIQREIEAKVKELIRSDLPNLIHKLSQSWLAGGLARPAHLPQEISIKTTTTLDSDTVSNASFLSDSSQFLAHSATSSDGVSGPIPIPAGTQRARRDLADAGVVSKSEQQSSYRDSSNLSVAESIEAFDPTYGLRPNALPAQSAFNTVLRLWKRDTSSQGLKDIISTSPARHSAVATSSSVNGDQIDIDNTSRRHSHFSSSTLSSSKWDDDRNQFDDSWESLGVRDLVVDNGDVGIEQRTKEELETVYERVPAVGGGTITRPRVFHASSKLRVNDPSSASSNISASGGSTILPSTLINKENRRRYQYFSHLGRKTASLPPPSLSRYSVGISSDPSYHAQGAMSIIGSSDYSPGALLSPPIPIMSTSSSTTSPMNSTPTTPSLMSVKGTSLSSPSRRGERRPKSPPPLASNHNTNGENEGPMTLSISPSKNDSCAHLTTLTHSHQTLSPYTRAVEHFTSRSFPRGPSRNTGGHHKRTDSASSSGWGRQDGNAVKVNRTRIHRIGRAKLAAQLVEGKVDKGTNLDLGGGHHRCSPNQQRNHSPMSNDNNSHHNVSSISSSTTPHHNNNTPHSGKPSESQSSYFPRTSPGDRRTKYWADTQRRSMASIVESDLEHY